MVADGYGQYRSIGADRYLIAYNRGFPLGGIATCRSACLKKIIYKHNPVPYKAMMTDGYELTNKTVWLNFRVFPNPYIFLYFGKRTYEAVVADGAAIEVYRLYNLYSFTKAYICYGNDFLIQQKTNVKAILLFNACFYVFLTAL